MKMVKRYVCSFCSASPLAKAHAYAKPADALAHEGKCFYNPETHSCGTCAYLGRQRKTCSAPKPGPGRPFTTNCKHWKLRGSK
jgi:hypothetical protein